MLVESYEGVASRGVRDMELFGPECLREDLGPPSEFRTQACLHKTGFNAARPLQVNDGFQATTEL